MILHIYWKLLKEPPETVEARVFVGHPTAGGGATDFAWQGTLRLNYRDFFALTQGRFQAHFFELDEEEDRNG